MNQLIKKGKTPTGFTRVDTPKVKDEQIHIHFDDGSALNQDGSWKHGDGGLELTRKQKEWLIQNGWTLPTSPTK